MKVFISWSGKRSKAMAGALKDWLPLILQYAEPWVSDKDIGAGDRWAQAIAGELETSNFGILCITPENLNSEWILFEAGALSKSMQDAKVIPLLFGLELSDLSGPLSQFQAIKVDQQGMLDVAKSINGVAETKAAEATIQQLVPALWPQLESALTAIPDKRKTEKHMRPQTEILEELVSQVRGLGARMRDFDPEVIDHEARFSNKQNSVFDHQILNWIMHKRHSDLSLVVIAGLIRDRVPWLADVLIEARRDLRNATPVQAKVIGLNLMDLINMATHSPQTERLMRDSKPHYMLMMEMPGIVDRTISHMLENRDTEDRYEQK
ncbi:MAG: hypothetical protein COA52_09985 [Hyphomicrobiales bacterium]|nr:TIR domain-containing protein [Hyphomicrobiales bacterium]PCJ90526.1 MAG: hypothetical protein COA52_09985 [Hyphomicrobiales bacterium]